MTPNCPNCKGWLDGRDRHDGRVTLFSLRGTVHALPSMWLAGMVLGDKREPGEAFELWAWHCAIEIEQERAS